MTGGGDVALTGALLVAVVGGLFGLATAFVNRSRNRTTDRTAERATAVEGFDALVGRQEAEIGRLAQGLDALRGDLERTTAALAEAQRTLREALERAEELEEELSAVRATLAGLERENVALRTERDALTERVGRLEAELDTYRSRRGTLVRPPERKAR